MRRESLHNRKLSVRRAGLLIFDSVTVLFAYHIASSGYTNMRGFSVEQIAFYAIALILALVSFSIFRCYSSLWKYAEAQETMMMFGGITLSVVLTIIVHIAIGEALDALHYVSVWAMEIVAMTNCRLLYRLIRSKARQRDNTGVRTMIVGAGSAGLLTIKAMQESNGMRYAPIIFVDDDKEKWGCRIGGIMVGGGRNSIVELASKHRIAEIILAMPSVPESIQREIAEICMMTGCKVKTLPSIQNIMYEGVSASRLQDIDITFFLKRDEVVLPTEEMTADIAGQVVLVTGGGGSIGSELCRQVATLSPKQLVILDIIENGAFDVDNELHHLYPELKTSIVIASVRDRVRLDAVFEKYKPTVVFHAAAHKHVPIMEENAGEAVKNNVFGTLNVAQCADRHGVKRFVMISTDKAVNPTNVMGATKRVAEMIIQYMSTVSATRFVIVRFGNVLESNGSVIPFFKKQISYGGPVTVTHPEITRFFMTIPEAAQLVIRAGAMANGGEVFVLDMGEPIKIDDLARKLITLAGLRPDVDIPIEYIGLRPGEKLYEELLLQEEGITATKHKKIYTARPMQIEAAFIKQVLALSPLVDGDNAVLVDKLEQLIGKSLKQAV